MFKNKKMKYLKLSLYFTMFALLFASCTADDDTGEPDLSIFPELSIDDVSQAEGLESSAMEFKVTLSGDNKTNVLVTVATLSVSAIDTTNEAEAVYADYVTTLERITFAPGETVKTFQVEILGDDDKESDETFEVLLYNPSNARLARDRATGTIENDDEAPDVIIEEPVLIPSSGFETPTEYPGMTLVWNDEFDMDSLDLGNWCHEIGTGNSGWGNNELQYYQAANTRIIDGNLVITAREQSVGNSDYTSSRIITQDKQEFKFGRIDIRAVLPEGQGLWPALWMLGHDFQEVGWPTCGEIDIMELVGHQPNKVHGTAHFGENVSQHQFRGDDKTLPSGAKFSEAFHVFSIVWEENSIKWYMDNQLFHILTPDDTNPQPYPFNDEFFFIFNVAVGGDWPGSPNQSTIFPQHMIVDYVRVFQ